MVFDLKRIISGLVLISLVFVSYYFNSDFLFFNTVLVFIFYDLKYSRIIKSKLIFLFLLYLCFQFSLLFFFKYFNIYYANILLVACILLSIFYKKLVNFFFVLVLFIFLINAYNLMTTDRFLFYFVFFLSFINDTTAYVFGKTIKGPLITPKISPKKTWSGTILSFLISLTIIYYFNFNIFYSILISLSFFFGDIYFSYIKRFNNIKDFSNLIIGHGGLLDRFDSIFIAISIIGILII